MTPICRPRSSFAVVISREGASSSGTRPTPGERRPKWRPALLMVAWRGAMCEANVMTRVKVLYHDNCFDGASSASLFSRFYRDRIDGQAEFVFTGKSHGTGNVYEPADFDGDVNAVVDFRYSSDPRLDWWFDHHVSGFPSPTDEAHF